MTKRSNTVTQHRSAKTGKFVTEKYAKSHPSTTVKEKNNKPSSSGGKKKK